MDHFAGLDASVKETSLCIVDEGARIVREVKVASEPEALLAMSAWTCRSVNGKAAH
jgi:transposase